MAGWGGYGVTWFTTGFAELIDQAKTDDEKWRVRNLRKRFLQRISATIARRNWAIVNELAHPRAGGAPPPPPHVPFEE